MIQLKEFGVWSTTKDPPSHIVYYGSIRYRIMLKMQQKSLNEER
jgi:hypothetical protein